MPDSSVVEHDMRSPPSRRPLVSVLGVCTLLLVAGCLGASPLGGTSDADPTVTPAAFETPTDRPVDLAYDGDYYDSPERVDHLEEAARVEVRPSTVVVSGHVLGIGDRPCLTMDASATRFPNGTLAVHVRSGSTVPESKDGCNATATTYDYRAVVETVSAPDRVVVTHGDGPIHETSIVDVTPNDAPVRLQYGEDYLDYNGSDYGELAAVVYENGRVAVTGRIEGIGDESCIEVSATARNENETMVVDVSPGVNPPAGQEWCEDSARLYEFRAAVDTGVPPERVVVSLDGERFAATGTYDGTVLRAGDGLNETP